MPLEDHPYHVVEIRCVTFNRSYITITQRNPSMFLYRVLQLIRQGWDGQHYRKAQGPSRLVEDVEVIDKEHKEIALKRDEREGRGPVQGFHVIEHRTTRDYAEAKELRDILIQLERTYEPRHGYNQGWKQRQRLPREVQASRPKPSDVLPDWNGEPYLHLGDVSIRLVPPRSLPTAQVGTRKPRIEWPPHPNTTMELKYDPT